MSRIKKLTTEVVSQIAAGEVVERPTNIVKELVENALDANSTKIEIMIENGGLKAISVKDNGDGIPGSELELAFELHTTSKLDSGDPSNVATLGFRGEALASIAAVSIVECRSRSSSKSKGKEIKIEGGKVVSKSVCDCPLGTLISVRGLFFNTPARRKFLKTATTERKRIMQLVTSYCLKYPDVHFILTEEVKSGQTLTRLESPSRKTLLAVVYDVLGDTIAEKLIPVSDTINEWNISGFISTPDLNRADRSQQYLNINGRPVTHPELQSAVEIAYSSQLMRNSHPILILEFDGPLNAVDFNIHPQKSEVRFKSADTLLEKIPEVIKNSLKNHINIPELSEANLQRLSTEPTTRISEERPAIQQDQLPEGSSSSTPTRQTMLSEFGLNEDVSSPRSDLVVHAHIMDKFGLVTSGQELWLVDIHAADERIKFELYSQGKERRPSSQQFLQPISISLVESEKTFLIDNAERLKQFGMKISNGGKDRLLIHSIPVFFDQEISKEGLTKMIFDILDFLERDDNESPIDSPLDRMEYAIVSRLACHGSIRSGYKVSPTKIREIVVRLLECDYPWTCAHGRPTILRIPKSRLETWFKR